MPPIGAILIVCIIGAQLPTWMFINSLSLIVHTTLLNTLMPPQVFYVFKKYLYLVRMSWQKFNNNIEESYNVHDYATDDGLYSAFLESSDYEHLFARNLVIVVATAMLIFFVWSVLAIVDFLSVDRQAKKLQ